jgi:hypothetical protein
MLKILTVSAGLAVSISISGCGLVSERAAERTKDRLQLMGSSGPRLNSEDIKKHMNAYRNLRLFALQSLTNEDVPAAQLLIPIPDKDLVDVQVMAFGYVEARCTAYLDAIFWTGRTQKAGLSTLSAGAAATGSILAATGGAASTIGIVAAAFGLTSSLFETTTEKYLYSIEPSNIVSLTEQARGVYETALLVPTSEAQVLRHVQGYILLCSPVKIEALVNEAVKSATIVVRQQFSAPLTADEYTKYTTLSAKSTLTPAEAETLNFLRRRYLAAGQVSKSTGGKVTTNPSVGVPLVTAIKK